MEHAPEISHWKGISRTQSGHKRRRRIIVCASGSLVSEAIKSKDPIKYREREKQRERVRRKSRPIDVYEKRRELKHSA